MNNSFAINLPLLGIVPDGATRAALRMKANELLWLCQHVRRDASQGIDMPALQEIARERRSLCKGATTERRLVDIGRPGLRFLGWWRVPTAELRFHSHLERYVIWMRDERGFSSSTVVQFNGDHKFAISCSGTGAPIDRFAHSSQVMLMCTSRRKEPHP